MPSSLDDMKKNTLHHLTAEEKRKLLERAKSVKLERTSIDQSEPIESVSREQVLPLSFAQQRLWFLAQLEDKVSRAYHMPGGIKLTGVLDREALTAALDRIVRRHEVLHTTFPQVDGVPVQVIAPPESGFALRVDDLTGRPAPDVQTEVEQLIEEEASNPFDLAAGPLIRGRLIKLSKTEHILLVTMHHIVSDGWSMGVLINEVSALYQAYSTGRSDPLPPLAIQYADYAVWQRKWLEGEVLQKQLGYWVDQLSGAPELLELPTDHPRPAEQDYSGASIVFHLDAELTKGLKALSRRHGVTLFMTLLAGWVALLSRMSGQEDIVIGTPFANRTRSEIEPLIGFFVNTLALRIDLSKSPTVAELLARVKQLTLDGQSHQDIPFEQVVDAVNPVRSLSHSPLFQVMFAWQNNPEGRLELGDLQLEKIGAPHSTTQFDLSLSMQEAGDIIVGSLEYATALFEQSTLERYLGHWQTLLKEMAADETRSVYELKILSEVERRQLLYDWNETETEYPKDKCMHQLFEEQAQKTPEAVAVVYEDKRLTYRELNEQANRLAHHLIAMGVGPDSRVAIGVARRLEMVVGLLAILKAGGAYVPLDPAYPVERLEYMLEDSSPLALLTQSSLRGQFGSIPEKTAVIELDGDGDLWSDLDAGNIKASQLGLTPHHLAYVIYTSGSTGKPKGVMIEHHALTNFLWTMRREPGLTADDVLIAVTTLCFDIAGLELWLPLLVGACCIVASRSCAADGLQLKSLIERSGATVLQATPSTWRLLLAAGWQGRPNFKVLCGGEALARDLAESLVKRTGKLWNVYGPTEATIWSNIQLLTPPIGPITIGHPIANTQMYILDRHLQPVPIGVAGELYIGGIQLARGYLNRPELTAERFMANPFVKATPEAPNPRIYKTGDLGMWLPDGTIEFLGRNDFQVKIRGFRIELGEIESKLAALDGVKEAVVLAREDETGDNRLIAYYTGSDDLTAEALRTQLSNELPDYMVPVAYVRLEALPLTPNGKLDRKVLPAPEGDSYSSRAYEEPIGQTEQTLAQIWAELLKVDKVGRHDNFFDLGGHSLMVIKLVDRLKQYGFEVQVAELFIFPTLWRFAAHLSGEADRTIRDSALPIRTDGKSLPLFLVHEISGEVTYGPPLARHIDSDIPVYGLAGVPLGQTPLRGLHAQAKRLVRLIYDIHAEGPYRIAGWSSGGMLAYEIATQLIGDDKPVEFLGLIDTSIMAGSSQVLPEDDSAALLALALGQTTDPATTSQLKTLSASADFAVLLKKCQEQGIVPEFLGVDDLRLFFRRYRANEPAYLDYYPKSIPIPIHFFKAKEQPTTGEGSCLDGWLEVLPKDRIRVISMPGTHHSMIKPPHIEALGSALSKAICQAGTAESVIPETAYKALVTIQPGRGSMPPVFCVPGAGDNVFNFCELTAALGAQWTVHGLQQRGLDGRCVPHATVTAAAQAYLREIAEAYPEGPFHLLGHSYGGWIVFEMALRLQSAGRDVASVTIIDSAEPDGGGILGREYNRSEVLMEMVELFEMAAQRPLGIAIDELYPLDDAAQLELLHQRLVSVGIMPPRSKWETLRGPVRMFAANLRTTYVPDETYSGLLYMALVCNAKDDEATGRRRHQEIIAGWRRFAPDLIAWHGPGNHMTILKPPYIETLAQWVRANLTFVN